MNLNIFFHEIDIDPKTTKVVTSGEMFTVVIETVI